MNTYLLNIIILSFASLLFSCSASNDQLISEEEEKKDVLLHLAMKAGYSTDPLNKGGDGAFKSLAIYIFNKETGYLEQSKFIPAFAPNAVEQYNLSVSVSSKTKMIYSIANYNDAASKTFSQTINSSLTMAQLDALTVGNSSFASDNILMVGKKELAMTGSAVTTDIPMERLVSRLDIYMYKSITATTDNIEVTSVELHNQILNSRCLYQNSVMISPATQATATVPFASNLLLATIPADLSTIGFGDAKTSIYSYQNIIPLPEVTPNDAITPYLLVNFKFNGAAHTAKGYITDDLQTSNKYSLMRNKVYRIIAIINKVDNKLEIKTTVSPWDLINSEIGFGVKDSDYLLNPFGGSNVAATSGIVQYPYAVNGVGVDGTSYADYSFKLVAPIGAVWTATLTNGLDFTFGTVGSVVGKNAVSTGIARANEYEIKVGATKSWGGAQRITNMYITVEGVKLKINPIVSGTTRKYPGTETDILITQTQYQ